jgi:hypothetical protein
VWIQHVQTGYWLNCALDARNNNNNNSAIDNNAIKNSRRRPVGSHSVDNTSSWGGGAPRLGASVSGTSPAMTYRVECSSHQDEEDAFTVIHLPKKEVQYIRYLLSIVPALETCVQTLKRASQSNQQPALEGGGAPFVPCLPEMIKIVSALIGSSSSHQMHQDISASKLPNVNNSMGSGFNALEIKGGWPIRYRQRALREQKATIF